jgi:GSH-dependent disulfide-bond oxidoreductase
MIELFYWPTPNGHKITIFLEETGLPYRISPIDIGKGEQFQPDFLKIAPNNRMPAIVDDEPADGGAPISIFESGAILEYLAEKSGQLLPAATREKFAVLQWLYWQMGGLGPMAGQNHHFAIYAPEKLPYAIDRYVKETNRLYGVLDRQLARTRDAGGYVAGAFSIADIASYPWIVPWKAQGQSLDDFPDLRRWFEAIRARPAVQRAYEIGDRIRPPAPLDEAAKKVLFGQTAEVTKR